MTWEDFRTHAWQNNIVRMKSLLLACECPDVFHLKNVCFSSFLADERMNITCIIIQNHKHWYWWKGRINHNKSSFLRFAWKTWNREANNKEWFLKLWPWNHSIKTCNLVGYMRINCSCKIKHLHCWNYRTIVADRLFSKTKRFTTHIDSECTCVHFNLDLLSWKLIFIAYGHIWPSPGNIKT